VDEYVYEVGIRGHQEEKTESNNCEITTDFFPGKVTYRKSNTVNERSCANQTLYLNHLGNIQQLIKHVLRPPFPILP